MMERAQLEDAPAELALRDLPEHVPPREPSEAAMEPQAPDDQEPAAQTLDASKESPRYIPPWDEVKANPAKYSREIRIESKGEYMARMKLQTQYPRQDELRKKGAKKTAR
ncbi:uncharacterized protein LOC122244852 [Penaeus japonicus]|uniref:uncharacterized protein LOC122244852 n=1 Tax=Penaeus japonicus TaxID=27405 RepID=UPI001C70EF15|nr:uncharacterized protein LOC122244852 [Penaeus japonicus]